MRNKGGKRRYRLKSGKFKQGKFWSEQRVKKPYGEWPSCQVDYHARDHLDSIARGNY